MIRNNCLLLLAKRVHFQVVDIKPETDKIKSLLAQFFLIAENET